MRSTPLGVASRRSSLLPLLRSRWVAAIQLFTALAMIVPPGSLRVHANPPGGPYSTTPASTVSYSLYLLNPTAYDDWVDTCNLVDPDYSQGYTLTELLSTNALGVPLHLALTGLQDDNSDGIADVIADYFGLDSYDPDAADALISGTEYTVRQWYLAGQDARDEEETLLSWTGDVPNVWKIKYSVDPFDIYFAASDDDSDGLTGADEYSHGTDPGLTDTDGDSYSDGDEITLSSNPLNAASVPGEAEPAENQDSDGDGIDDHWEWEHGLSYQGSNRLTDTDSDGFTDYEEFVFNTGPTAGGQRPTQEMYYAMKAAGNTGMNGTSLPDFFDEHVVLQARWVEFTNQTEWRDYYAIEWTIPEEGEPSHIVYGHWWDSLTTQYSWSTSDGQTHSWEGSSGGSPTPPPSLSSVSWTAVTSTSEFTQAYAHEHPEESDGGYSLTVGVPVAIRTTYYGNLSRTAEFRLERRPEVSEEPAINRTYLLKSTLNGAITGMEAMNLTLPQYASVGSAALIAAVPPAANQDAQKRPDIAEIVPAPENYDSSGVGKIGAMVPSNLKKNPERHFVTPKQNTSTTELNADHVVLQYGTGMTKAEFDLHFEWVIPTGKGSIIGGSSDPPKCKISRTAAEKIVVQVQEKTVRSGESTKRVASMLNVWVVWSAPIQGYPQKLSKKNSFTFGGFVAGERWSVATIVAIEPIELFNGYIAGRDVPNLHASKSQTLPEKIDIAVSIDEDTAGTRWDITRRVRVKLKDKVTAPSFLHTDFSIARGGGIALSALATSFPSAAIEIMAFPTDKSLGNDDPDSASGEDADPYNSVYGFIPRRAGEAVNPKPAIGQIASYDDAQAPAVRESAGISGEEIEGWCQFEEIARVELGEGLAYAKWYVISDPMPWENIKRFKRKQSWIPFSAEQMRENGSTTDLSHSPGY